MARTGWSSPLTAAVCAATLLAVGGVGAQQAPPAAQAPGQARRAGSGAGRRWPRRSRRVVYAGGRRQGRRGDARRVEGRLRSVQEHAGQVVPGLEQASGALTAGAAGGRPQPRLPVPGQQRRRRSAEPDAKAGRPRGDDGGASRQGAGHAGAAAQGAGAGQARRASSTRRSRSPRRRSKRSANKTKAWATTITYDPGRHQRREPEAVRRRVPRQHHRNVPGRSERSGRDRGAARRRCWTSSAAARALPASTPPATPITAIPTRDGARQASAADRDAALATQLHRLSRRQERGSETEQGRVQAAWPTRSSTRSTPTRQARWRRRTSATQHRGGASRSRRPRRGGGRGPGGPQVNEPLWPEFNKMIGGYFKFHWNDPQHITVKIDDPKSPLTAMFHGQALRDQRRDLHLRAGLVLARQRPRPHQHRLREDERRGQGQGAGRHGAHRSRLRAQLDPPRRAGPRLLRGARPQREELRDQADARARARRHPVRAGRSQGRRQPRARSRRRPPRSSRRNRAGSASATAPRACARSRPAALVRTCATSPSASARRRPSPA